MAQELLLLYMDKDCLVSRLLGVSSSQLLLHLQLDTPDIARLRHNYVIDRKATRGGSHSLLLYKES